MGGPGSGRKKQEGAVATMPEKTTNETALAVQEPEPIKASEPIELSQVHLVARNPNEMALATTSLTMFLRQKVGQCDQEFNELSDAATVAIENGWKYDTLERHSNLARKRGDFYRKVLAAVEAGYTIVPNFPIDLFAVRVQRKRPKWQQGESEYGMGNASSKVEDEEPQILAPGKGRYVNPAQLGHGNDYSTTDDKGKTIKHFVWSPTQFQDIAFPIEAARPEVMSAASEAMALKLFDAIGICPQSRKGDPLIIGQVLSHKRFYSRKTVSFLIAWHLDLRTL